jgi:LuxR family transcriptional regulator, maltose regulon positive regulatory protein
MSTGPHTSATLTPRQARRPRRPKPAPASPPSGPLVRARAGASIPERGYGVPAFRDCFVSRPALVKRLLDGRDAALALIAAPAGYGKSTLLAEWAACDERPFIWITLEPRDQDPVIAAASIAQAFEDMGWIDSDLWPILSSSRANGGTSALRRLMRALDREERSFVLVLDDAQAITPSVLKSVVSPLLEGVGQGSQIALASRTEPPLPIGRLRAHRALVEIRMDDLTMAPAEAATLLRLAGLELDFGAVQALSGQTEGWPAGLYLAALSLRTQDDLAAGLKSFAGDHHLVAEYFRDEFLAELSPKFTSFLIRTSVLDDLSGPLCDAVLERSGSGGTLAQLARRNLMLLPLDHNHERFRWHGLFKAMLRAELHRTEPDVEASLHTRASAWLGRHGDLDGAIGHAVAAGEVARAGDLLWANVMPYLASGCGELVQAWLRAFGPDEIGSYAPLALAAALNCLVTGDVQQARHWSLLAGEAGQRLKPAKSTPALEAGIAVIEAAAARAGAASMAEAATLAYDLEPEHSPLRPLCCLLRGIAEQLVDHGEIAQQYLEEALQLNAAEQPCIASLCLSQLTLMAIEHDDWDFAAELAERAAKLVARPSLACYPISALVFAASAATRAREGRVDEAKRDLRHGADLLAALGDFIPWYGAEARILLARAALGVADTVQARTLLAEASRLARRVPGAVIFQRSLDQAWAHIDTLAETALSGPSSLTIAELRILRFLPSHRSFREIAERLGVSVNTVKTQAHAIYRKLDAASRSEAVARASSAGLLGN